MGAYDTIASTLGPYHGRGATPPTVRITFDPTRGVARADVLEPGAGDNGWVTVKPVTSAYTWVSLALAEADAEHHAVRHELPVSRVDVSVDALLGGGGR